METQFVEPAPHVQAFVEQLLNAGGMLANVVEKLVDALVANGSSDEEATGDIVVALMGAVASRLAAVPEADFARATELMEQAADGVLAELKHAERLARRRRNHAGRRA
jgi:hypothetical protein